MSHFLTKIFFFLAVLICSIHAADPPSTAIIQVSPNGPINSLAAAKDHVRQLRAQGEARPIRIIIAQGVYPITKAIIFSKEDSGSEAAPITYEAARGATPIFTGGLALNTWTVNPDGKWSMQLPTDAHHCQQLWTNRQRATPARTPNHGYFHLAGPVRPNTFAGLEKPEFQAATLRPNHYEMLRTIPSNEISSALLVVMQNWTVSQCRIAAIDDPTRSFRIHGTSRYPLASKEPNQRYFIEHTRAGLDQPAEWFRTPEQELLYIPRKGESPTNTTATIPITDQWLVFHQCQHITLRGLDFRYTRDIISNDGHHDGQAAVGVPSAIIVNNCQHLHIEKCQLSRTGGHALWINENCQHCRCDECHIYDTGAGAIRVGPTAMPSEEQTTRHITVHNCILHNGGRRHPSACAIHIAHAANVTVTHCDIADHFYTGISTGWIWGYNPTRNHHITLAHNHIHHLGWGVLSDMGGTYNLGASPGTEIHHNHIHHIASYRYGGWGLYTDEGSSGLNLSNNIVHDTTDASFHQHYGRDNIVSNNILAYGKNAAVQLTRPEQHQSFTFQKNIVLTEAASILHGSWNIWQNAKVTMDQNLYWNPSPLPALFLDANLTNWQKKSQQDLNSRVAAPQFYNAAKRDFRLQRNSPAIVMGITPIDLTNSGVIGTTWRKLAAANRFSDFEQSSIPFPLPPYFLEENFDLQSPGPALTPGQTSSTQNKGDSIAVVSDHAHSAPHSLKITDAIGLDPQWDPYWYLQPRNNHNGTLEISFALRYSPDAAFRFETRDQGTPYPVGPSFRIGDGKIFIDKTSFIEVPADAWCQITITTTVGTAATGTWDIRLRHPDGSWHDLTNLPCTKGWSACQWLGFIADGNTASSIWIDDLRIESK